MKDDAAGYCFGHQQIAWYTPEKAGSSPSLDRSQGAVGCARQRQTTSNLSAEVNNEFCTITPPRWMANRSRAPRARCFATARRRTPARNGTTGIPCGPSWAAPTPIEPVTGWVLLRNIEGAVGMQVTSLDGSSRPTGERISGRRLELGWEFPIGGLTTTTYLIRPIR
jgi:hypothetical protein